MISIWKVWTTEVKTSVSGSSEAAAGGETVPHAADLEHLHLQNSQANAWLSLKVHLLLIVLWSISEFKLWVWVSLLPKIFSHFFRSRALYMDYMAAAASVWASSKHRNKGRMTERINIFISVALRPKKNSFSSFQWANRPQIGTNTSVISPL